MSSATQKARALPLVRTAAFLPFRNFLSEIGTPVDRVLQKSKLQIRAMHDPEALIPLRNLCRFLDDVVRREGIANLGFHVGLRTPIESLGDFGLMVRRSVTLWDALHTAERLVSTLSTGFNLRIQRAGGVVWVHHQNLIADAPGSRHADTFGLMMLVNLIRLTTSERWRPPAVRLLMPPDRTVADLPVFRTAAVEFQQTTSAIAVPAPLLSELLDRRAQHGAGDSQSLAERLQSSAPAQDLCGSVKQFLRSQIPHGVTDITAAAEAAGLSVRTLQRQLMEEGCEYSRLLEQTRFRLAVELLRDVDLKIVDIAQELGYGDAANFTRAFRRWTGLSPLEFRKAHHLPQASPKLLWLFRRICG